MKNGVIMNLINKPIEPEINPDGWWCQCPCCWEEVYPRQDKCCKCGQLLDWSWLSERNGEDNVELESKV